MSFREHPLLLRQSFVKLWPNNIFLHEKKSPKLHFMSFYQTLILLETAFTYRYTAIVATRTEENEIDFDQYLNIYKYQKNERQKKKRYIRSRRLALYKIARDERFLPKEINQAYSLLHRFIKNNIYQQFIRDLVSTAIKLFAILMRVREPIRRLGFLNAEKNQWFRRRLGSLNKDKHFLNTINQVILLHYYKSTSLFAKHFGRELEKVHKKVHWRLIHGFKTLLQSVPSHPDIRPQFHGLVIEIKGRPKGRARTFVFRFREGALAPQTYFFRISFGMGEAFAKVGNMSVKLWLTY